MRSLLLLSCFILLMPLTTQAAYFSVSAEKYENTVKLTVFLEPSKESINVVEGELVLPPDAHAISIATGSSIIGNWIEQPTISGTTVRFAGMIQGGFMGGASATGFSAEAPVFSVSFTSDSADVVYIQNGAVYKHDGNGTRLALDRIEARLGEITVRETPQVDRTPPEYIDAYRIRSDSVFNGGEVLIVDAQDSESGIAYYEVFEMSEWKRIGSLYPVPESLAATSLRIRAYDHAGNFREISVAPSTQEIPAWLIGVIIVGFILGMLMLLFLKRTRI